MEPKELTPVQLRTQAIFLRYMVDSLNEKGRPDLSKKYRKRLRITLQELNRKKIKR